MLCACITGHVHGVGACLLQVALALQSSSHATLLTDSLLLHAGCPMSPLQFQLTFPFKSAQQVAQGSGVGANYLLTYLDEDMLIGRASGTAGTFIFTRHKGKQE